METSLHRSLKLHYAASEDSVEVAMGDYRIDAIDAQGCLVEVQHAGLGSIRKKLSSLLTSHRVRLIKPLIRSKWIETMDASGEKRVSRRKSPKSADHWDIFGELIHITSVFPHPQLTIEAPLLDVVEQRIPKPHRYRRKKQYQVKDQTIVTIHDSITIGTAEDLWSLLGNPSLERDFDTAQLATTLNRPRWFAQQVAYVLFKCGTTELVGKRGNSKLYRRPIVDPHPLVPIKRTRKRKTA